MPGYLPDPPQIPVAGMGAHPTPQMNNSPAWNNPQALAQGIAQFAQNYMLAQKDKKKEAWDRVQWSLGAADKGIPIDKNQMAKDIKFLKLPVALDEESALRRYTPEPPQPQQSAQLPQAEQMMLAGGQMPVQGTVQPPSMPGVQGPPPQPVGVGSMMGGSLPVAPQMAPQAAPPEVQAAAARPGSNYMQSKPIPTTLGSFLTALQQQGWDETQMRASMRNILKGGLQGDPRALEMATRLGLTKTIGAHDEMFLMAHKLFPDKTPEEAQAAVSKMLLYDAMGGPEMERKKIEVANGMAKYFPGPNGGPDLESARRYVEDIYAGKDPAVKPQMSFDQVKDINDQQFKVMQQFPTSGNAGAIYGTLLMAGRVQDAQKLIGAIADHYPSAAQMEAFQKERAFNFDKQKHADVMQMDHARMFQAKQQFDQQYALNALQFYQGKARNEFNQWWDVFRNEKSTAADKETAVKGLTDALIKQGVDVTVDKVRTFWHPFSGEPRITIKDRGNQSVGTTMGSMKTPKNPFGEEDGNYWSALTGYLSKLPGFSYDFLKQAVTGEGSDK